MYWRKMGTFSTIVKRYVKTVDLPVSDHGGLFVKEARTHLFLEENLPSSLFRREVTRRVLQFHVVTQISSYALTGDQRDQPQWVYKRFKKIIKPSTAVAVAKERQSFAGGLNHRALTGKVLVVLGVCTWRFDFLFCFNSVYICSQITVDVETSFSDAIFSGLLVARFCPLLSLLICAGHLSEII